MKSLPNNCRVGKFSVNPQNWDNSKADTSISWTVTYRFYDDNIKKSKQIRRQGMNEFKELKERQSFTKNLIKDELNQLESGYNPILDIHTEEQHNNLPRTFQDAMKFACKNKSASDLTKADLEFITSKIIATSEQLFYNRLSIREIRNIKTSYN